jgi:WD40 repeat protein
VLGVAFNPNGKLVADAGTDGSVRLWNPATRRPAGAPLPADTGRNGGAPGVAFSPTTNTAKRDQYAPGEPQPKSCT